MLLVQFALYAGWLTFLSWMIGRAVTKGAPSVRALLCVVCAMAVSLVLYAIQMRFDLDAVLPRAIGIEQLILHAGAPATVIFALSWWFGRQARRESEIKIFE